MVPCKKLDTIKHSPKCLEYVVVDVSKPGTKVRRCDPCKKFVDCERKKLGESHKVKLLQRKNKKLRMLYKNVYRQKCRLLQEVIFSNYLNKFISCCTKSIKFIRN